MLAKCPICGKTILIDNWGYNYCKFCKKEVLILNPNGENPQFKDDMLPLVLESSRERTFFAISKEIFSGILKSPGKFFASFQYEDGERKYIFYYGIIILTLGLILYFQVQKFSFIILESMAKSGGTLPTFVIEQLKEFEKYKIDIRFFDFSTLFSPLIALLFLFFTNGIFFLVKTFGGKVREISELSELQGEVNFVSSSSYTSWIFWIIPILGVVYSIFLFYKGLKERLKFSTFQIIISIFLQLIFINFILSSWIGMYGWIASKFF